MELEGLKRTERLAVQGFALALAGYCVFLAVGWPFGVAEAWADDETAFAWWNHGFRLFTFLLGAAFGAGIFRAVVHGASRVLAWFGYGLFMLYLYFFVDATLDVLGALGGGMGALFRNSFIALAFGALALVALGLAQRYRFAVWGLVAVAVLQTFIAALGAWNSWDGIREAGAWYVLGLWVLLPLAHIVPAMLAWPRREAFLTLAEAGDQRLSK